MRNKGKLLFLRAVLIVIMVACMVPVGRSCYLSAIHEREQRELKGLLGKDSIGKAESGGGEQASERMGGQAGSAGTSESAGGQAGSAGIAARWEILYAENDDLVGWLTVGGTKIDYPVMQCADDEFYLHHNFHKEEDRYGCLYVRARADVDTPGTNFIIYGHNMKDGSMFGELDKYESESFYREHREISFDTLYEERTYEVLAVFRTQITEGENDGGFRYYQFYQADTEEEFRYFYENMMKNSIYDTGVRAEYGDTFLTLSTCSSYAESGRFVVVAKRIA